MSLVNLAGERIYLQPKPEAVRPVRSAKIRARNFRWLQVHRKLGLSVREVAQMVGQPRTTVSVGIRWAEAEEALLEARAIAAERPTVLDEASGLDVDDVLFLLDEYPAGTEIGDNPDVREFLGRMAGRIEALGYDVGPLTVALAGAA